MLATHQTVPCRDCGQAVIEIDWLGFRVYLNTAQQPITQPVDGFELYDRAWFPVHHSVGYRRRGNPIHAEHVCPVIPREGESA